MENFDKEIALIDSWKTIATESVKEAVRRYDFVILDYLTNKQWFQKGQKLDGKIIKPAYSRITVSIKQRKGDPYDRVTLRDTGRLYESIDILAGDRSAIARVSVPYFKKLQEKYGDKILGIQDVFIVDFAENYVLPLLTKNINDSITTY